MDDATKDILQGLKTAIEAELTGYNFYKQASESIQDPGGKEAFGRMAEEEKGHYRFLRHQYNAVLKKGGFDFSKELIKKVYNHKENPIFSQDIKDRIKESHFEVSALTIGMKLELEALQFYRSWARKVDSKEAKAFFLELAQWEEDHYLAFERELDMLKEDYFTMNNFVPM